MAEHRRTAQQVAALIERRGPGPWTLADVLAEGWTAGQVRRAVEAGRLQRIRRGVLAAPGDSLETRARAALMTLPPSAALSHSTAAVLRGQWTPGAPDGLVDLSVPGQADEVRRGLRIHGARRPETQVEILRGMRMTTAARTAVDLARGRDLPDALLAVDAVARLEVARLARDPSHARTDPVRELATARARDLLLSAYADEWGWPGTAILTEAIPLLDAGSESPFESRSRGQILLARLPSPVVGVEVVGASGRHYWVDFLWRERMLVGEADGLGKYGGSEPEVRAALRAERERQSDLESAGFRVVRWTSAERPSTWISRLASHLSRE